MDASDAGRRQEYRIRPRLHDPVFRLFLFCEIKHRMICGEQFTTFGCQPARNSGAGQCRCDPRHRHVWPRRSKSNGAGIDFSHAIRCAPASAAQRLAVFLDHLCHQCIKTHTMLATRARRRAFDASPIRTSTSVGRK